MESVFVILFVIMGGEGILEEDGLIKEGHDKKTIIEITKQVVFIKLPVQMSHFAVLKEVIVKVCNRRNICKISRGSRRTAVIGCF